MMSFSRFCVARLATLATLAVGTVGITLGGACVQDQDYLIVENAVWFSDRDECELSDTIPASMTVDVLYDTQIAMGFLLTNMQNVSDNSNTGVDDAEIKAEYVEVTLSFSGGALSESYHEITVPNTAILGGDSAPFLIQLPISVTESLRATMMNLPATAIEILEMEVVFHARRSNQSGGGKLGSITTRPFVYPLEICFGCLGYCQVADQCDTAELCSSQTVWDGTCGFAQGLPVIHPMCEPPG
jgi:hypothetical protein